MLSYGDYVRGTGLREDPMLFTGGSEVSCKQVTLQCMAFKLRVLTFSTEKKQPGVLRLLLRGVRVRGLRPAAARHHPALVGGVRPLRVHRLCLLPPGL